MKTHTPISYPPEAILTLDQLAEWVQAHPDTVKDWPIPRLKLPGKMVRFSAGQVLAFFEGRAVV